MKIVAERNGKIWNENSVQKSPHQFVEKLLGKTLIGDWEKTSKYEYKYSYFWYRLERDLQNIKPFDTEYVQINVPTSMMSLMSKHYGIDDETECMQKALETSTLSGKENIVAEFDQFRVPAEIFREIYTATTRTLIEYLRKLLHESTFSGINTIYIVGELSESTVVQDAVQKSFGLVKEIIFPTDARLAVLKGAVFNGHITDAISS